MTKTKLDKMFENDFLRLPRPFIRMFNLNTAVMLSEIYSEYTYWKGLDKLEKGGWFYSTVENMYCNTGLSKHQQLRACKELEAYGVIKIKYHGLPKKRYFKFDTAILNKLYTDFQSYLFQPREGTGSTVLEENHNIVKFAASF
ncbi:MAG: hypothetical protein IJ403_04140 [Oscillospiraceae bacterium]|nr:hypothetical protein [Oscillospiraceae bacterium]